jgi:integrase
MTTKRIPQPKKHATGQSFVYWHRKCVYFGRHGTPKADAAYKAWVRQLISDVPLPPLKPGRNLLVADLCIRYLDFAKDYYKGGKEYDRMRMAARAVKHRYDTVRVDDFGPLALSGLREQYMIDEMDWSRTYINAIVNCIRRIWRWGVSQQIVRADTLSQLEAVDGLKAGRTRARESKDIGPVAWFHYAAVLPYLTPTTRTMVRVHWLIGCRPGELCIMRPCDIKPEGSLWHYTPSDHKTAHLGKELTYRIGPRAQSLLWPYMDAVDRDEFVFDPREAVSYKNRLPMLQRLLAQGETMLPLPKPHRREDAKKQVGERYNAYSYRQAVQYGIDAANERLKGHCDPIPAWTPHQLRHSKGTIIRKLFGLEGSQVALGHSSISATQLYAETDGDFADKIAIAAG